MQEPFIDIPFQRTVTGRWSNEKDMNHKGKKLSFLPLWL